MIINGQNFLGVNKLGFTTGDGTKVYEVDVDPRNPPAGITFAANGTTITITGSYLYQNAYDWIGNGNSVGGAVNSDRHIRLYTANLANNATAVTTVGLRIDPTNNDP